MKRTLITAVLFMVLVLAFHGPAAGQNEAPEYQIKAAMIYNFTLFIEWPRSAFASDSTPFFVGVLGEDPFGPWLENEFEGAAIGAHPVVIIHADSVIRARQCHVLFISRSLGARLPAVLDTLKGTNCLTIGDTDEFCRLGGAIGFVTQSEKIRFMLNEDAAADAALRIDPRLKRVATAIITGRKH